MASIEFTWASERVVHALLPRSHVLPCYRALTASRLPGVAEVTPGSNTVQVRVAEDHDPDDVISGVRSLLEQNDGGPSEVGSRVVEIPICSDADLAPDLEAIAQRAGLSAESAADLHASGAYTVRMLGFSPGFAYIDGLPAALHAPRLDTPRPRVRAGSVGIANAQTGIYPQATPGGWQVIGATPLRLFDPARDPPTSIVPGDRVVFRRIDRGEFDRHLTGGL